MTMRLHGLNIYCRVGNSPLFERSASWSYNIYIYLYIYKYIHITRASQIQGARGD